MRNKSLETRLDSAIGFNSRSSFGQSDQGRIKENQQILIVQIFITNLRFYGLLKLIMNFEILGLLSQLPSKKYVRKLFEYAYLFRNKLNSFQEYMETPVSAQLPQDLQMTEKQAHTLIIGLVKLLESAELLQWNEQAILQLFPSNFDQQLAKLLTDSILQISELCDKITNREICQADSLIDIDWRVDIQIQTHNQQKVNMPVLFLQLETLNTQKNTKENVTFQLNQNEVNNFHNNLCKIKEQLQTLAQ
ncbi:unnamed protein product [Paramecium primaurelia]|uniref:COMM domain-containing protein n=1 Tax=Paramecium primaurelia TaxID=5886 RepID=A0A8S1K4K9_PARPR|nr:unnamed protein product [Paramecium primaurelia]